MLYGRFLADALSAPGYSTRFSRLLTSDRSGEREEEREGGGDAGEGGAIRATTAAATSALAAATAASRCKESCARERAMAKSRGQTCYERKKDLGGKERGTAGGKVDLPRKSEGETTDWLRSEPTSTR